jgi:HEAT repeat protein
MPLVRREPEGQEAAGKAAGEARAPAADEAAALAGSPDPAERRRAARALASRPGAVPALAAALGPEPDAAVREAILAALATIGGDAAARALIPALRSEDAGLRNGAIEALRAMPGALRPHLPALLADPDSDVRILAAELARSLPPGDATRVLCDMLRAEGHPNACAAALDVLAEVGTADALPTLHAVSARFAADAFVPFAARAAVSRIEGARSAAGPGTRSAARPGTQSAAGPGEGPAGGAGG